MWAKDIEILLTQNFFPDTESLASLVTCYFPIPVNGTIPWWRRPEACPLDRIRTSALSPHPNLLATPGPVRLQNYFHPLLPSSHLLTWPVWLPAPLQSPQLLPLLAARMSLHTTTCVTCRVMLPLLKPCRTQHKACPPHLPPDHLLCLPEGPSHPSAH